MCKKADGSEIISDDDIPGGSREWEGSFSEKTSPEFVAQMLGTYVLSEETLKALRNGAERVAKMAVETTT